MSYLKKIKQKGDCGIIYENEHLTVIYDQQIILNKCHADDCIVILIGFSKIFDKNTIKQLLKISGDQETKRSCEYEVATKDVDIDTSSIKSGTDDAGVTYVMDDTRILFEGTKNDAAQIITAIGILIGKKTAYQIMTNPDSVDQIFFGFD